MTTPTFQQLGKHYVETYYTEWSDAPYCDLFVELHIENECMIHAEYIFYNISLNHLVKGKLYDVKTRENAFEIILKQVEKLVYV
jgi:hypothetical protein